MDREELQKIALKEKSKRISMSDVPEKSKALFVELAEQNFGDNYGQCLKWCLEQALEYQDMKGTFFSNIDMKLDILLDRPRQPEPSPPKLTFKQKRQAESDAGNNNQKEVKHK